MATECHITRRTAWYDEDSVPPQGDLTREEWLTLVEAEPDMERAAPGSDDAYWSGHPDGADPPFRWDGDTAEVTFRPRDDATVARAVRLAAALSATVQTDDNRRIEPSLQRGGVAGRLRRLPAGPHRSGRKQEPRLQRVFACVDPTGARGSRLGRRQLHRHRVPAGQGRGHVDGGGWSHAREPRLRPAPRRS